jgi:hypothetical protein
MNKRRRIAKAACLDGSGWLVIVKRLEGGSFQLPPLNGTEDQIQVDGPTLTSLLAGIDFTASRSGWYRKNRHDKSRLGTDGDLDLCALDVEALERENAQLREQLARVVESHQTLTEQIAILNDRITELLAVARRRQRKPATEKPPIAPPEVTQEAKRSFEATSRNARSRSQWALLFRLLSVLQIYWVRLMVCISVSYSVTPGIDNSPTEHEFQNVAKLRLNMRFVGSTEGTHRLSHNLHQTASRRRGSVTLYHRLGNLAEPDWLAHRFW